MSLDRFRQLVPRVSLLRHAGAALLVPVGAEQPAVLHPAGSRDPGAVRPHGAPHQVRPGVGICCCLELIWS